jgi:hypothetical protein
MNFYISIFISLLISIFNFCSLKAQNKSGMNSKYEIGIDLVRYNRNWIYYNNSLHSVNADNYSFDLMPNFFAKVHFDYFSLRLKYEHLKKDYLFKTNSATINKKVDGTFSNNRYFIGVEKCLINNRMKSYAFFDVGLSETNFKGLFSTNQTAHGVTHTESFNTDGVGIAFQPGLGIKYRLFSNFYINLESSIYFENGLKRDDPHLLNPKNKLIPRPISSFGFSTYF